MPWAAAAGLVSAGVGAYSANSAAKKGGAAGQQAINLQQQAQQENVARNAPYLQAGNEALGQLRNLATTSHVPTAEEVMATPGYQFQRQQGMDAVQQGAAATSGNLSGAAQKALARYGSDFATTHYQQAFDNNRAATNDQWGRFAGLAGMGQHAADTDAGISTHAADAMGSIGTNTASFQGAAGIAGANQIGGALTSIGAAGKSGNWGSGWFGSKPEQPNWNTGDLTGAGAASGAAYVGFGGEPPKFADGGPVHSPRNRMKKFADGGAVYAYNNPPVVGSRSPVRSGGGGGLSPNAIRALLQAAAAASAPGTGASGVGGLPANPLTDPRAILADQESRAGLAYGGPVYGPGGPKEDAIPAMLSNGEHVIDAASVNAAGGGSNKKGQAKLNKLRAMLKQGAC